MRNIPFLRRAGAVAILAAALTVSGGLLQAQKTAAPSRPDARTVAHVLDRIGFGARPGDIARIQQAGLAA